MPASAARALMAFLALATWILAGVMVARATTPDADDRRSSLPLAALLGPFWLFIVVERRQVAETERRHHIDVT